jgi:flotillin
MISIVVFLVGAATVAVAVAGGQQVPPLVRVVLGELGSVVIFFALVGAMFTRLYRKAAINVAFVRTGLGGARVIKDGGCLVFPHVHKLMPVLLETRHVTIDCRGTESVTTSAGSSVEITAEFYAHVQRDTDGIFKAARSLGVRTQDAEAFCESLRGPLADVLTRVAATKSLAELQADRIALSDAVCATANEAMARDGVAVELVRIVHLAEASGAMAGAYVKEAH